MHPKRCVSKSRQTTQSQILSFLSVLRVFLIFQTHGKERDVVGKCREGMSSGSLHKGFGPLTGSYLGTDRFRIGDLSIHDRSEISVEFCDSYQVNLMDIIGLFIVDVDA